ncbi:hypothetical protein H4R18_005461 [Coemansia javaensis]|uniref:Actin-related protein n=1 Tax=Coemansia javaensis TaxID=2761396 RepID=A0A9W8H333_9FUNG|nr:hypothetical protein H4R18_005461 [Coemansia javaensis]
MVAPYREESFVVVELGGYTTKAMQDVSDVNKLPTVHIRARAGILKQDQPQTGSPGAGDAPMQVDAPEPQPDGQGASGAESSAATINDKGDNNAEDDDDELSGPNYVFGSALESAGQGGALERTVDIMPGGVVEDWDALSAFLRHVVTRELGIRILGNASAFLFSVPPLWTKADQENLVQIAFEHLNAPAVAVMEQPLMALYGNNKVSGVVIDVGHGVTTVSPVVDSCVQSSCVVRSAAAGLAVTRALRRLLQEDPAVRSQFDAGVVPLEFAAALKEAGRCTLHPAPAPAPAEAAAAATADGDTGGEKAPAAPEPFEFGGKQYAVSSSALAGAAEVLLDGADGQAGDSLAGLVHRAVLGCDPDRRAALWESLHLVGGSSQLPGLRERLQADLEATVLPASNIFAVTQTRDVAFHAIPEYLVGWRNHAHWTPFLGACLAAKVMLADSKHFVSRAEYNDGGPSTIHTKAF